MTMTDHTIECEVCGREHDWDDPHRRHNRQETELSNGECITHCRDCDTQALRGEIND